LNKSQETSILPINTTTKQVIKKSGVDPRDITSIAFSGQMAGILALDKDWNSVMNYDSWLDIRCREYLDYIKQNHLTTPSDNPLARYLRIRIANVTGTIIVRIVYADIKPHSIPLVCSPEATSHGSVIALL